MLPRISTFALLAALTCTPFAHAAPTPIASKPHTPEAIASEIQARRDAVEEFRALKQEADAMGVKLWLFGGTASGFAHYVRQDIERNAGDSRYAAARYDYSFPNIYHSKQDIDLVVDGTGEQAKELQRRIETKFKYFMGSKSSWEIRPLREAMDKKLPLLDDFDFLNQHTDSNSTGMIELTDSAEPVIKDLRDWNSKEPGFLKDIAGEKLTFYFSEKHGQTKRAKEGLNPPIIAATRYLIKLFQFHLTPRAEDLAIIQRIITEFKPESVQKDSYVDGWLQNNVPKLIQFSSDIEYSITFLDQLGFRKKMIAVHQNVDESGSFAWWMNKEPLRSFPVGKGKGKTLREILVANDADPSEAIFSHETNSFLSYESIKRSPLNVPNVLVSRPGHAGEAAAHGWGHYTLHGTQGARGTGYTIRYRPNLDAREGKDFVGEFPYIVFRNRDALTVIPEQLNLSIPEFLKILAEGEVRHEDKGILERLRRQIVSQVANLKPEEFDLLARQARALLTEFMAKPGPGPTATALGQILEVLTPRHSVQKILAVSNLSAEKLLTKIYQNSDQALRVDPLVFSLVNQILSGINPSTIREAQRDGIFRLLEQQSVAHEMGFPNLLGHLITLPGSSKFMDKVPAMLSDRGMHVSRGAPRLATFLRMITVNPEWHPRIQGVLEGIEPALRDLGLHQSESFTRWDVVEVASLLRKPSELYSLPDAVLANIFDFTFSHCDNVSYSTTGDIAELLAQMDRPALVRTLAKYANRKLQTPGTPPDTVGKYLIQNLAFAEQYRDLKLWDQVPIERYGREAVIGMRELKTWKDRAGADTLYLQCLDRLNGPLSRQNGVSIDPPSLIVELTANAPASKQRNDRTTENFKTMNFRHRVDLLAKPVDRELLTTLFRQLLEGPGPKDGSDSVSMYKDEQFNQFIDNFWQAVRLDPTLAKIGAANWHKITSPFSTGINLFPLHQMTSTRNHFSEKKAFLLELLREDAWRAINRGGEWSGTFYGITLAPWFLRDAEVVREARASLKRTIAAEPDPFLTNLYLVLGRLGAKAKRAKPGTPAECLRTNIQAL